MAFELEPLLKELNAVVGQTEDGNLSEPARVAALQAARKLVAALEKPKDSLLKLAYGPVVFMSVRIGVRLEVFAMLSEKEETSVEELVRRISVDKLLITRILRVLTAAGYVAEKAPGVYGPTETSRQLHQRETAAMIRFIYDLGMPAIARACNWLDKNNHRNPTDGANGPFQDAFNTDKPIFLWLEDNPKFRDDVDTFFEGDRGDRPSWVEWFPMKETLLDGSRDDADAPLLVDVAGGRGHDISQFRDHFPNQPGRLVLQDQQVVLDGIAALHPSIEKHPFNFFEDSPVPGARIYFLKFVLHDWSDEVSLCILANVKKAMQKGYSYLVIEEFILPEEGCPLLPAMWDLVMLIFMCGMERTKEQWRALLQKAGLPNVEFYHPPGHGQGIIVAELPAL